MRQNGQAERWNGQNTKPPCISSTLLLFSCRHQSSLLLLKQGKYNALLKPGHFFVDVAKKFILSQSQSVLACLYFPLPILRLFYF